MGISYDIQNRRWNVSYEKTDNRTDYPTNLPTNLKTDYPTNYDENATRVVPVQRTRPVQRSRQVPYQEAYTDYVYQPGYGGQMGSYQPVTRYRTSYRVEYYTEYENYTDYERQPDYAARQANAQANATNRALNEQNSRANQINSATNQSNQRLNQENTALNSKNSTKNQAYDRTVAVASNTKGGDYVTQRELLRNIPGIDSNLKEILENNFKAFYSNEKLQTWDPSLGAKPPYGDFDPAYYKAQNPAAVQQWQQAVANDDIDITQRYNENSFYLQHYTTQGKPAGVRGNPVEEKTAAKTYVEKKPTDKDLQDVRNLQLGVDMNTQTDRLLQIPEIAQEWQKAKNGDPYWSGLAKEKYLNPDKADEFVALFRLSERPEDQQVRLNYNVNTGYGVTELEDAINEAVGEKAIVDVKRFGALTQNVLKDTIEEMKKAKAKENMLSLIGGFGSFGEIININKELTNSILGDTGVGGILSFTSGGKAEEKLTKQLQNVTGIGNTTTYNWQQWFDNAIKEKYNKDLELGYTVGDAKEQVKIDAEFAKSFIEKYLVPRFDTSRSMDEFVEYLDVRQEEQNPFQTQDLVNSTTQVANLRAQQYLDQIKQANDRYFDSSFYFNPTGNKARESDYALQAKTVSEDWAAAKAGDSYWASQAYRFGVDVNDKDAFARMHFQVKGQGRGFDAADDILNASKVKDQIYNNILPALKEEALKQGSVFGQFITPEEFADEMLKGLDPNDKNSWEEVLKRYGLTDFKGTIEELKDYIMETLRTGSAQKIREEIKYLNEKRQRPTQEVLGLTYIQRPEDYKDELAKPQTELFKVFQSAGYQGTEDEFYNNFFPDLDRSEQTLLTKAGSDTALKTYGLDFSDPFASLGTIESFFGEDEEPSDATTKTTSKSSDEPGYFKLGFEDFADDEDYKSKTGQKILGEFTSMFKGL